MRLILALTALLFASTAMAIDLQRARKEFFDGCFNGAVQPGTNLDNPVKKRAYCTCMTDALTAVLTPAEWDYADATGQLPPRIDFNSMVKRCVEQEGIRRN